VHVRAHDHERLGAHVGRHGQRALDAAVGAAELDVHLEGNVRVILGAAEHLAAGVHVLRGEALGRQAKLRLADLRRWKRDAC
jgi:hypothetical protein